MVIKTINPTTEQILAQYDVIKKEELDKKIVKSKKAFLDWKGNIKKRSDFLNIFADVLRKNKQQLALTATKEMGKTIKESLSEVENVHG